MSVGTVVCPEVFEEICNMGKKWRDTQKPYSSFLSKLQRNVSQRLSKMASFQAPFLRTKVSPSSTKAWLCPQISVAPHGEIIYACEGLAAASMTNCCSSESQASTKKQSVCQILLLISLLRDLPNEGRKLIKKSTSLFMWKYKLILFL